MACAKRLAHDEPGDLSGRVFKQMTGVTGEKSRCEWPASDV
jgi:hypothetical protein